MKFYVPSLDYTAGFEGYTEAQALDAIARSVGLPDASVLPDGFVIRK